MVVYLIYWSNVLHVVNQIVHRFDSRLCGACCSRYALIDRTCITSCKSFHSQSERKRIDRESQSREYVEARFCSRVGGCVHPMTRNFSPAFPWPGKNLSLFLFPSYPFLFLYLVPFLLRCNVHRYSRTRYPSTPHLLHLHRAYLSSPSYADQCRESRT